METGKIAIGESGGKRAGLLVHYITRHGIIAGSTGTGKSRAMQVIAEQLVDLGVNVFVSDVKGDASGFCVSGEENEGWKGRNSLAPFVPHAIKTNYWSVSPRFAQMRFSVSEAGSVLFSRLLSLNPTQESHLAIAFSHAKKKKLKLDSIEQLLDLLDGLLKKKERGLSASSIAVIERKLVALEESGLYEMFGKPNLELGDLQGLNVLNLSDARKNMLASIAPAFLLNKLFNELPEAGDTKAPKYAIFFDEAHYLFKDANKSLKDLMVTMLKQIRSKSVAVFFVTQDVGDLPEDILSQLATKIIFAQKVFTEKGTKRLGALAKSFPNANKNTMETLKSLPTGVALVSTLEKEGKQGNAIRVNIFAPATTMEVVEDRILRKQMDGARINKYVARGSKKDGQFIAGFGQVAFGKTEKAMELPKGEKPMMLQKPQAAKMITDDRKKGRGRGSGFSLVDAVFSFLLKLLDFVLAIFGKLIGAIAIKPLQGFAKYLAKKPIRVIWLALFIFLVYAIIVNWGLIESFLASLKLK